MNLGHFFNYFIEKNRTEYLSELDFGQIVQILESQELISADALERLQADHTSSIQERAVLLRDLFEKMLDDGQIPPRSLESIVFPYAERLRIQRRGDPTALIYYGKHQKRQSPRSDKDKSDEIDPPYAFTRDCSIPQDPLSPFQAIHDALTKVRAQLTAKKSDPVQVD